MNPNDIYALGFAVANLLLTHPEMTEEQALEIAREVCAEEKA